MGVPSPVQGSGIGGLCAHERSMPQGLRDGRVLSPGSSPWGPVRRRAHPLPALIRGYTCPSERPLLVCAWNRPGGPIDGLESSAPSPGQGCSPGGRGLAALKGGPGGRGPRRPRTPLADRRCRCSCLLSQSGCPRLLWHPGPSDKRRRKPGGWGNARCHVAQTTARGAGCCHSQAPFGAGRGAAPRAAWPLGGGVTPDR